MEWNVKWNMEWNMEYAQYVLKTYLCDHTHF